MIIENTYLIGMLSFFFNILILFTSIEKRKDLLESLMYTQSIVRIKACIRQSLKKFKFIFGNILCIVNLDS